MTPASQRCTLKSTFKTFGNHKMFGIRSGFFVDACHLRHFQFENKQIFPKYSTKPRAF
jgi:hypothetical protein